jgi:hypothetical protein
VIPEPGAGWAPSICAMKPSTLRDLMTELDPENRTLRRKKGFSGL